MGDSYMARAAGGKARHWQRYFLVDQAQWDAFNAMLDRPAKVKPGLKKLMQHKAPWDK